MPKKLLIWGGVTFLIFFIAFRPNSAAKVFTDIGSNIWEIVRGFGEFFVSLAQ